jgi:hypothetical protein
LLDNHVIPFKAFLVEKRGRIGEVDEAAVEVLNEIGEREDELW